MKASLGKRMTAYLIDLAILIAVLGLIGLIYHPDISVLTKDMDNITMKYAEGDISFNSYILETSSIYKQMDIASVFSNIFNVIFIIGYFILLPYFNNGKTIGKQLMHIEVRARSNQQLSLIGLFVRNLIINGLLYFIAVILCALLVPENIYFWVITGLGIVQIGLLSASILMVLYRKDKKGLHDLIARTWVAASK